MPLFQVAIVKKPSKDALEKGTGREELLYWSARPIIASSDQTAAMRAARELDDELLDSPLIEVLVLPFV